MSIKLPSASFSLPSFFQTVQQRAPLVLSRLQLTERQKQLAVLIGQAVFRVFFILASFVFAGAVCGSLGSWGVTPIVFGSVFCSSFLFQIQLPQWAYQPMHLPFVAGVSFLPAPSQPIVSLPLSAEAPRGLVRTGMNCCFNSAAQVMRTYPELYEWIVRDIPDDTEGFLEYLTQYEPREQWLEAFTQYQNNLPEPRLQGKELFCAFLRAYQPLEADRNAFAQFAEKIQGVSQIQPTFSQFFQAYDRAMREGSGRSSGQSQDLRGALSSVCPHLIDASRTVQLDAEEIFTQIFSLAPSRLQGTYRQVDVYETEGRTPIQDHPDGRVEKEVPFHTVPLAVNPRESLVRLEDLFQNFTTETCVDRDEIEQINLNGEVQRYPRVAQEVHFSGREPQLLFSLKRVSYVSPPDTWLSQTVSRLPWGLSRLLQLSAPQRTKAQTEVLVPLQFDLQGCNYALKGAMVHQGTSPDGGHYVSYIRTEEGSFFECNDQVVRRLSEEEFLQRIRQATFLSYRLQPPA